MKDIVVKPMKVVCTTCKGEKTVWKELSPPISKGDAILTAKKIDCPDCNGEGFYTTKRL